MATRGVGLPGLEEAGRQLQHIGKLRGRTHTLGDWPSPTAARSNGNLMAECAEARAQDVWRWNESIPAVPLSQGK